MRTVEKLTTKSHVTIFGDAAIANEPLTSFEGSAAGSNRLPAARGTPEQRAASIRSEVWPIQDIILLVFEYA